MVNTPLPQSLEEECKKAAKILKSFSMDKVSSGGVDRIIPPTLIANAKGLAILTVIKAGFLVTARAGSGLVIARLPDGSWSAPSAIATAGLGGGFEVGAEITDFVFILNSPSAVDAFSKGGNMTLGGNMSVALGPIGRNTEADVAVRSPAAIYTYSKTQGLFAGISLEGSGIFERKEANKKMYRQEVRSKTLLTGGIKPPDEAFPLYQALKEHVEGMVLDAAQEGVTRGMAYASKQTGYDAGGSKSVRRPSLSKFKGSGKSGGGGSSYSQQHDSAGKSSAYSGGSSSASGYGGGSSGSGSGRKAPPSASGGKSSYSSSARSTGAVTRSAGGVTAAGRSGRAARPPSSDMTGTNTEINSAWDAETVVQAQWDFFSDNTSDLNFHRGDKIVVVLQTGHQDDWWEGTLRGKTGIFPANYVKVL